MGSHTSVSGEACEWPMTGFTGPCGDAKVARMGPGCATAAGTAKGDARTAENKSVN